MILRDFRSVNLFVRILIVYLLCFSMVMIRGGVGGSGFGSGSGDGTGMIDKGLH